MTDVSIITPSYNMREYLIRCCRSVRDQGDVGVEHIVVDGGSTDGSVEWLRSYHAGPLIVEPDRGMYDAINKGLRIARGAVIGYLNCDEQYLPGTLGFVQDFFVHNAGVDLLFGDHLLVRPDGTLIAYRKAFHPVWWLILATDLYVFSCAMFFRRRIPEAGIVFREDFRDIGDEEFVVRCLRSGYRARYVRRYLAVFTMTGANMSCGSNPQREKLRLLKEWGHLWLYRLHLPLWLLRALCKGLSGAYFQQFPLSYAIYVDAAVRQKFVCQRACWRWRTR